MDSMSAMKTENRATSFRLCNRKHSVMKTKYRSNWVEMMHLHFHTLVCERARVYSLARSRSNSTTFVFYKHFRDFSGARFCRFRFFLVGCFFSLVTSMQLNTIFGNQTSVDTFSTHFIHVNSTVSILAHQHVFPFSNSR